MYECFSRCILVFLCLSQSPVEPCITVSVPLFLCPSLINTCCVFCVCGVQALATEDAERDLATTVMGIYLIQRGGDQEPEDFGVGIEGIKVLSNLGSVTMGFVFGLIYALDLSFPDNLKYTFEFFQKIIMNLDGHKLNAKIQQLKIKLFP
uniref:Uncharacterized protein n=1 Tax=Sander lucioperca TaxID=283035 RepID=A0A8D0AWM8_SANLU